MSKKKNKASVKKDNDNIVVSYGNGKPTKYDIMTAVAKKHTIYGATVWLNTPIEEGSQETPADLMQEGNFEKVQELINKIDESVDI